MAVVLVTGASSGIGRCCAAELASRGHRVYGASRTAVSATGVLPLRMDVSEDGSVSAGVAELLDREGRLDAVVNNAGIGIAGAMEDTSIEEARHLFEVNLWGALRVIRAALPAMRKARSGLIVNVSSIAGLVAIPYQGAYTASKFALEGLTEALRLEVRQFGIRVVLVEPGDCRTEFTQRRRSTSASIENATYRGPLERSVARMACDEQTGASPGAVARVIARLIDSPDPRLRYTTGPAAQCAAVWVKRLAPYALLERILRRYYEI